MYALIVFGPRTAPAVVAAAGVVFSVLRVAAARRDVVAFGLLWQRRLHDVLQLRQVGVLPPPRVHAGADVGDALLSVHRLDGVGVL